MSKPICCSREMNAYPNENEVHYNCSVCNSTLTKSRESKQIVSTLPYEQISAVKIFHSCNGRYYIEFILENATTHAYVVKEECEHNLAFGKDPINTHWDTEWSYTPGGAESFIEKFEIDELLSWSEPDHVFNWRKAEPIDLTELYLPTSLRKEDDWVDPAGGVHSFNEADPAKMYE